MNSKSILIILKIIFCATILYLGIFSFNYLDFFNTLENSLNFTTSGINEGFGQGNGFGNGLGGGFGKGIGHGLGRYSITPFTTGYSTIFAYIGIVAFIVLIVYYLEKGINRISRITKKK